MGSNPKPPNPQHAPKAHGRKPSAPGSHKSSGKGACDMWVPVAIAATVFYGLPKMWIEGRRRRGR